VSRILIAEDEPRVAAFLDKGLRASGFTTTVAADGDGADAGRASLAVPRGGAACSSKEAAAAVTLTSAATPIAAAARAARSARVPLLVVKNTVLPRTWAVRNSRGELLRSNPGIGSPCRSPATSTPSPHRSLARRRASRGSATGTIARQPFASAVMIVVEARRTSITSAVAPPRSAGTTASAVGTTSIRTG